MASKDQLFSELTHLSKSKVTCLSLTGIHLPKKNIVIVIFQEETLWLEEMVLPLKAKITTQMSVKDIMLCEIVLCTFYIKVLVDIYLLSKE